MSFYAGKEAWLVEFGQRDFNRLAGERSEHIPLAVVDEHLHELTHAVVAIEHYVDRRIAHHDKRGIGRPLPTFADLTMSLKTLERIVIFYWQFLKGPSMTTMLPTIQFDWQDVFCFPWSPQLEDSSSDVI